MIKANYETVNIQQFPDGTAHIVLDNIPKNNEIQSNATLISWLYDNDAELFALCAIVDALRQYEHAPIVLNMPYIPNARMDRVKDNDVFTLKTFANIINSLNFERVNVLEAHSSVSLALINNVYNETAENIVNSILLDKTEWNPDNTTLFFPDEGAMKRYSDMFEMPYTFGMKNRDWKTGKILSLNVIGNEEFIKNKDILIIDDISSRGSTFYFAAKALLERGAKSVSLFVSHCENTILEGDLFKEPLLKHIYTTDSIFTAKDKPFGDQIEIVRTFR